MTRDVLPEDCSLPADSERVKAAEAVQSDPGLTQAEKEFTLTFAEDEEFAPIYSEIPSTVRGLLQHPYFGIKAVRVTDTDSFGKSLSWEQWQTDEPPITGVRGYVPIGVMKIQQSPRKENYPSTVVSDNTIPIETNGGDSP